MKARISVSQQSNLRRMARPPVWATLTALARPTASMRVLPDYLVIGAQRSGTTSLQRVLQLHPNIKAPRFMKGVHYFDTHYDHGPNWYKAHFHTEQYAAWQERRTASPLVAGEASPYYLFHPAVPGRIKQLIPDVKLIALLRDPVERAVSHHRHEVRRGDETLDLATALAREPDRLTGEEARLLREPDYVSRPHQDFSYVARGQYADQLERYLEFFPADQMLVLESEEFFTSPQQVYGNVLRFLGVPVWQPDEFPRKNATGSSAATGTVSKAEDEVRESLTAVFADSNRRLAALTGRAFSWI